MATMPPQSVDDIVAATLPDPHCDNGDEWQKSTEKVEVNHIEEDDGPSKLRDVHTDLCE